MINEKDLFGNEEILTEKKKFFKLKDPKNNDISVLRTSIKDGKNNNNASDIFPSFKKSSNMIKMTEVKKTTSSKFDNFGSKDDKVESSKNQCIFLLKRLKYARE